MKKLTSKQYLIIASLIFGMFFGAGNLIFPVHLTLGPLFATPRTATVPFSRFSDHFSKGMQPWALLIYSAVFFGIVYYCSLSEGKITDRVGKILNPSFLALLFIIFLITAIKPMGATSSTQVSTDYLAAPLTNGFLQGYNTLDALAALAFGITVVTAIKGFKIKEGKETSLALAKTGAIGFAGIAIIYLILVALGAGSLHYFKLSENGGIAFAQIVHHYLGTFGEALLATLATITCMSTAIGLVVAFAQDFHKRFPKISYRTFLTFNCLLSFAIADFGLNAAPSIISNTAFAKAALAFAGRYLPQKIQRESKLCFHAVSFYSYSKKFGWKGLPQMSLRPFFLT